MNGLGKDLSIWPVHLKAVQVPIARAKNRFNVAILQNLCSPKNKLTAKIHIKDSAGKRRCLRQSDRIRRCLYWPEDLRSGILQRALHIKSQDHIILSN